MMSKKISAMRRNTFYIGTGMLVLGISVLLVSMVLFVIDGDRRLIPDSPISLWWVTGVVGILVSGLGSTIRRFAARGVAGSGLILDLDRARKDLEPFSRMAGGMLKDALDENDRIDGEKQERKIMIKCRSCGGLSQEKAKYCYECGDRL